MLNGVRMVASSGFYIPGVGGGARFKVSSESQKKPGSYTHNLFYHYIIEASGIKWDALFSKPQTKSNKAHKTLLVAHLFQGVKPKRTSSFTFFTPSFYEEFCLSSLTYNIEILTSGACS